jgi:hypothetical protein
MRVKVKFAKTLTSGIVRDGDLVELDTVEDVIAMDNDVPKVVIPKGTVVFGKVADRAARIAFLRHGKFKFYIDEVKASDGTTIKAEIYRPQADPDPNLLVADSGMPKKERERLERELKKELARNECVTKDEKKRCVSGRVYAGTVLANLPSALLTAATAGLLTVVKDSKTRVAADITLVNSLSSQQGLSAILNGTDQEIDAGDIFEIVIVDNNAHVRVPSK